MVALTEIQTLYIVIIGAFTKCCLVQFVNDGRNLYVALIYSMIKKDRLNFVRLYFLKYMVCEWST